MKTPASFLYAHDAASGFFERQRDIDANIGPAAHAATATAAARHAEHLTEDVAKGVEDLFDVVEMVRELLRAGVAELIVAGPLLAVGEDLVGLGCFLELLDGLGVAGIAVGVKLDRQLAISRGDFPVGSVALQTQDFVVIAFGSHRGHGGRKSEVRGRRSEVRTS